MFIIIEKKSLKDFTEKHGNLRNALPLRILGFRA